MNPGTNVTDTLLGSSDKLLGAGILGMNYNGKGESETYNGSIDYSLNLGAISGENLVLGFVSDNNGFLSDPLAFQSMSLTLDASNGSNSYDKTWNFSNLSTLDSILNDNVVTMIGSGSFNDLASTSVDLSYSLTADGPGRLGFDTVLGLSSGITPPPVSATPEPASWILFLTGGIITAFGWMRRKKSNAVTNV
jgi:hypothetical protein